MQPVILEVDAHTAKMWLDKQEAVLIDVREPSEYEEARIANAVLIPLGSISIEKLPTLQVEQKIIVQCARGVRSARAIEKLSTVNPELKMYNLIGGISEWIQLGLPITKGK